MNQAFPGIIRLFKLLSLSFALWAGYAVDANANQAPVADAGADQTVSLGSVELDGSASSDPDGDTLLYAWEIVDEPEDGVAILTGAETVRPTLHIEAPGQYVVSLRVSDGQLESPPDTVVIQTVNRPPVAVIEAPAQVDEGAEITLSGHSSYDPDHDSLTFQWSLISRPAQSQTVIEEPTLEATVFRADKPGSYTVGLTVSDGSADSDPVTAVIVAQVLENHPPKITTSPYPYGEVLSVYEYDVDAVDEDGDDLVFSVEDAPAGLTIDAATGLVHWVPSARGSYGFAVVVTDARGAVTRQYVRLNIRPSAADEPDAEPAPVPVLQPLPFPGYFDANRFLIESDPPRQKDVTAYPFADGQTAGVSGHIRDLNGYPLANVAVQVADHPEYGYTLTDGDGNYRILFPGGGQRRLRFDKTGYVPAYRGVAPDWGEDRVLGEQVLLARNPQGAEVYLNGEVSELIPVSGAGTSQGATLLFDAGDTVLPVGETIPLPPETTLFLRLTDFSQSEQKELPAPLPDTWNASNVVVLSEDEYVQGLVFGQPHPVYLPNHQQYPLGTGLYVGHFNPASGTWQEKGAGHVLKIIDKQDGQAVLSVDADGSPMDPGQLAALGITGAERAWLAEHYGIGDMVQRMPVSGTGIWAMGLALLPQAMDELPEEPPYEPGVELPPVTQQLPLEGSSYALQYSSERARGYALSSMAMIPLTGEAVSDALVKVELVARVAGREYRYDYDPEPGLEHRFLWDGLDYFGRAVNGRKRLKIEVNHYYKADYPLSASLIDEAFGDLPAGGAQTRQSGSTLKVTRQWEVWLGNYTNEYTGLGGWSLNVHHAFDPASGTLYLGDTHSRKYDYRLPHNASDGQFTPRVDLQGVLPASPQSLSIAPGASGETAVSTDRLLWHFSADGQLQSSLDVAQALGLEAQDPLQLSDLAYWHGNLLAVDKAGHRLLQLTSNGASILAAAPAEGCSDGIFCEPVALAPGTEGPLIIAARGSRKLYQWDGQGGLRAYAGSGEAGEFDQENGDGGLARHAAFGQLGKIAWDQAHNLYVADNYPGEGYRIRRISMNGYISTVLLETSPARVTGLVVDSDGTLVVGQSNCRMILLSADGVRTEVDMSSAGGCSEGLESLAIGPDGRLLAGDLSPGAVMRWESRYVNYADDAYKISDPALPEVYWFDDNGRHLRTTDSLGNNHYVFAYDADGYLQQVTNSSGADLQITRNPDGSGSQLQLSTGGTWTLTYNGQKLLIQAVKPNGDTHSWTYTLPGMLASAGDSSGALEEFYYTPYGETWPAPYSYAPTVQQDQLPSAGPSNLVASLPGEFAVTGNGAASYAVPIEIPPGRGKLTPKLTLQYNSQGGSGLLGMGWSLGGLSTIHRCKQTWAQDNKPAAVEMHADDALCLDGRRMLRVNNVAQGHVGSEYRLELDDFSVIKLLRDSSSNLMYFEVWTKSGEIMEYGRTQ
ncbi:PKD domain-containing protein, partial [Thiolapillus sp.]